MDITSGSDVAILTAEPANYLPHNETADTSGMDLYMQPEQKTEDLNCNLDPSNDLSSPNEKFSSPNEEFSSPIPNDTNHPQCSDSPLSNQKDCSINSGVDSAAHDISGDTAESNFSQLLNSPSKTSEEQPPNDETSKSIIEEASPDFSNSEKRKVFFPDDNLVTGFLEPYNPWATVKPCTPDELLERYRWTCDRHQVRPIPILLEQLQGINLALCNDRYDMLSLKGIKLDHKHIETFEEILKRVQFKTLDFENTNLDDDMAISLFDMIEFYESCSKLNIAMNPRITFRGFQTCSRMMKKNHCLETLDLRGIIFADISMPALARSLRVGCSLTVLHLENCNICGRNLLILVSAVKMNENLRELFLSNNKMMTTDGIQLGALLKINRRLQLLDVRNNFLGDVGASHLCDGLYEQTGESGLLSLSLWSNALTHLGMPAMAQALKRCVHLQTLNLANNAITSEGAHYLREGLLCNRSLLRLSLYGCKISCEGAVALAEYIADTKQLLRLDLRENDVRTGGLMALSLALRVNTSLSKLDLDRDPKKDPGVKDYLQSQRDSMQQIEEHLRRNRNTARETAERQLEEEANQLSELSVTNTSTDAEEAVEEMLSNGLVDRPSHLELEIEVPQTGGDNAVAPLIVDFDGGRTPSPTVDHLGSLVSSPTDEVISSSLAEITEEGSTTRQQHRVVGMRSEMKKAGSSGRTFMVTTTVFDEDPPPPMTGEGGAAAQPANTEAGGAADHLQDSTTEEVDPSESKPESEAEAAGGAEAPLVQSEATSTTTTTSSESSADGASLSAQD